MSKVEELIAESKLNELLKKKDDEKVKKTVIWVLAIVGAVAAVAAIAYAVYCFFTPDYLEDFEEDFDDDFDDYFSEEDRSGLIRTKREQKTGCGRNTLHPVSFFVRKYYKNKEKIRIKENEKRTSIRRNDRKSGVSQ